VSAGFAFLEISSDDDRVEQFSIRELVDQALLELSPAFDRVHAREGRPSIPPERLLRALLLQAF
jgi:hypothetical protein